MNASGKDWVIDGLMAKNDINMLLGKPGAGKSWIAAAIAVSVASRSECLGYFRVSPSPVIWIDEDTPTPTMESRLRRLCRTTCKELESLPIKCWSMQGFRLNDKADIKSLTDSINTLGRDVLVVVDCLDAVCPALNTNRTEDAKKIQPILRQITAAGATLLVVHHLSLKATDDNETWESSRDFTPQAMGNTKLVAMSDTILGVWQLSSTPLIFGLKKRERRTVLEVPDRFTVRFDEDPDRKWAMLTYSNDIGVLPTENAKTISRYFVLNPGYSLTVRDTYDTSGQILGMRELRLALHELEKNGVLNKGRLKHNLYTYQLNPRFRHLRSDYADAIRQTPRLHTQIDEN